MRMTEMIPNSPIAVQKSVRSAKGRVLTSGDAGKILPLKYEWLHREDGVRSGKVRVNVEMMETSEMLMNGVGVTLYAHFVPMLAFDRFNGSMDELNRSYKKENGAAGSVIPFFESNKYWSGTSEGPWSDQENIDTFSSAGYDNSFFQVMGIHTSASSANMTPVEAYNAIINHRRKARSKSLPLRNRFDASLADAFWINNGMQNIVPDYDQNLIDGQVTLAGLTFQAPIKSKFARNDNVDASATSNGATAGGSAWAPAQDGAGIVDQGDYYLFDEIFAELQTGGNATMSLADIEQARKTAAFAKLRAKYDGIDDEHVIDLLMSGIRVPEEALKQPILLGRQRAMIGFNQRYATDGANLDKSATNGMATIDMSFRTPAMNTGGVIMICAEIVPEQLWERKKE